MKISRYTFCFDLNSEEYYIYSTLSNALVQIDEESYEYLKAAGENKYQLQPDRLDAELWQVLVDKRIITDNDRDNFLTYKSMIMPLREQKNFMHLTLAPTMECNFRCFYCFETEKPKGKMALQTMNAIIKHVASMTELTKIYLTWFGGEPLMALPQMEQFYDKLCEKYDKEFDSNLITTGYYLTEAVIPILQRLRISSVQITLDGHKERHNKIKHTQECEDVFSRVLSNIDLLTQKAPEINVAFRVNITKQNAAEYVSLYKYLLDRYAGKNITIAPGFVVDRNNSDKVKTSGKCYFEREEISLFLLNLWNTHHIYTPWLRYPNPVCSECAIRDQRAVSFDSEGYIYKCWEMIGQRQYAIGQLDNKGHITNLNKTLLNRQLYGADPMDDPRCSECSYLPICDGGCPIQRIENEFINGNNDVCCAHKGYLKEFMKIHIALKKAGFENR